jgi:oxaloacetate decarboxylase alpha subunit
MNYLIGVESGVRVLHTAPRPMANGPSLPSTEQTVENLRWEGHTTRVDLERVRRIGDHMRRVAEQEGHLIGVPHEYNVFPYHHQLPGGMTGTLKAQLAQYDMSDRFEEVLEEIVHVRHDLGHPISATPFSQLMGIQAVLNVVTGERYGSVPDEVLVYVLGHLGRPPAPIDEDVLDRMLSTDRGAEMQAWEPPQPTVRELKQQYGDVTMSDEELLRRYLVPLQDVEATRAAGPAPRAFRFDHDGIPASLIDDLLAASRIGLAEIETGGSRVTLRR